VSLSQATIDPKAQIVSEHDAKLYTGLSRRTLQRQRLDGRGPHFIRLKSKKVAYRVCDLLAWVAERLVTSTSDATVRGVGGLCPTSAQCLKSASCAPALLDWMMTKGRSLVVDSLGGAQEAVAINKSGLWSLVLTSRKPEAKRFKKWLASEVIPAIRKTGAYVAGMPGLGSLPVKSMFSRKLCRSVEVYAF